MEIIKKAFNKIKNKIMNNEEQKEEEVELLPGEEAGKEPGEVPAPVEEETEDKKVLSNEERRTESVGKNEMAPEVAAEVKEEDIDKRSGDGEKVSSFL